MDVRTCLNPNLDMIFLAFFSPLLCLALDTSSSLRPAAAATGSFAPIPSPAPPAPVSSSSGIESSDSDSVPESGPLSSTTTSSGFWVRVSVCSGVMMFCLDFYLRLFLLILKIILISNSTYIELLYSMKICRDNAPCVRNDP